MNSFRTFTRIQTRYRHILSAHFGRRMTAIRPKVPIVSFTFDDFPRSALQTGGMILAQYGARGTYYVSLGLMGKKLPAGAAFLSNDLETVLSKGHELGCHTFAHCHAWETPPDAFEHSIIENQQALCKIIPGTFLKTLSYPIGFPRAATKRRASKYFDCCRCWGESFNFGATDANSLSAVFLEKHKDNYGKLDGLIDENSRVYGWLIFATHDVGPSPSQYGCTPHFFERIVRRAAASGAKILPVSQAWEFINNSPSSALTSDMRVPEGVKCEISHDSSDPAV